MDGVVYGVCTAVATEKECWLARGCCPSRGRASQGALLVGGLFDSSLVLSGECSQLHKAGEGEWRQKQGWKIWIKGGYFRNFGFLFYRAYGVYECARVHRNPHVAFKMLRYYSTGKSYTLSQFI